MLMTIWKKDTLDLFVQMLGKKYCKMPFKLFPCDKLKGGAKISASIQSHLL